MGKRVERSMDWLDDVGTLIAVNSKKGSEHTVEYEDRDGNYCIVRVPASFTSFLTMYSSLGKTKLRKAA